MSARVHIHFGPGPLGLGLPVAVTTALGIFDVHLVGQPKRAHHPAYYFRTVVNRSGAQEKLVVPVASFSCPASQQVPEPLRIAVADAELILITVSMREHIAEGVPLITKLCELADKDAEIVFIACENNLSIAHTELIDALRPRVQNLRAIVDRVCTWAAVKELDKLSLTDPPPFPRHVIHHEIGEWIIERPGSASLLPSALKDAPEVVFADAAELPALVDRKIWLVNGMHMDVGIRGRALNQPDLRLVVNDPERLGKLQETIDVMASALKRKHRLEVEPQWALDRLHVVCQLPDATDRVLRDLHRADPTRFLRAFGQRVGEPARVLAPVRALAPCLDTLAGSLSELLQDPEQYSDWHSLNGGELNELGDNDAIMAYCAALQDWMPDEYINREAARLRVSLRRHRGMFS